jgi:hypothetical protein
MNVKNPLDTGLSGVVAIQPPSAKISEPRNNLQHSRQGARLSARSPLKNP